MRRPRRPHRRGRGRPRPRPLPALTEGGGQRRRDRRAHGGSTPRDARARALHAAGEQRAHVPLIHGAEELLARQGLANVLEADQEGDDEKDPHDPRAQHDRHLRDVRDRQDGERHRDDNANDDRYAANPRVAALEARGTAADRALEAVVVRQGRHDLRQAVAVRGNARRLGQEEPGGRQVASHHRVQVHQERPQREANRESKQRLTAENSQAQQVGVPIEPSHDLTQRINAVGEGK